MSSKPLSRMMGGIGKTGLSVKLAEQIQQSFEYLIWRSLRHAPPIQEIFNGDIAQFLAQSTLVLGDILPSLLYQQFERMSDLEKGIIYCVAIENDPISIPELKSYLCFSGASLSELLSALESLKRRSLLEEDQVQKAMPPF